jgi:hypothetical protein
MTGGSGLDNFSADFGMKDAAPAVIFSMELAR